MVLDLSRSMEETVGIETLAAKGLLSTDQASSFALLTFTTQVDHKVDFAEGRTRIANELARLESPAQDRVHGRTAVRDALVAAVDLLRPTQFGDAIFLVSDGGDNSSRARDSQCRDALVGAGIRLFALVPILQTSRGGIPEGGLGPAWVQGLVTATGGDFTIFISEIDTAHISRPKSNPLSVLSKTGQQIMSFATVGFANEIDGFYRLGIKLPEALNKPRDLNLDVVDSNGKRNNHWRVVYPQRLAACP